MVLATGKKRFTYQDYLSWTDEERWEIIAGEALCMGPAPSTSHQRISGELYVWLREQALRRGCLVFFSPIDVILDEENVVQPDIIMVCDQEKVKEAGILGAPDLVVEVLSPTTALKDKGVKRLLYERFSVQEYLLVDPIYLYVERYHLEENRFVGPDIFGAKDQITFRTLPEASLQIGKIFGIELLEEPSAKSN